MPKDRIFALLSLSRPRDQEAVQIDYDPKKPAADTFMKIAAHFVQENGKY